MIKTVSWVLWRVEYRSKNGGGRSGAKRWNDSKGIRSLKKFLDGLGVLGKKRYESKGNLRSLIKRESGVAFLVVRNKSILPKAESSTIQSLMFIRFP